MIYLTEEDILRAASVDEVVAAIEESVLLYERGDFLMPDRMHIDSGRDTMLVMPCFIDDYFATKLVTLFPGNPELGVPVLNGIVCLNDIRTGLPIALFNGPVLTALRTAAATAVSIRHLAPPETKAIGIVGAGVQGFYQAWYASSVSNAAEIYIYDIHPENAAALAKKLDDVVPDVKLHQASTAEELLANSHVVITATTSRKPVLPENEELLKGKHFIGLGSYQPTVREFPRALYNLLETIQIDTKHALDESGDLIVPLQEGWITKGQIGTLGKHITNPTPRPETTFFKSVGMALFDVCAAKLIYEKAKQKGIGQEITL